MNDRQTKLAEASSILGYTFNQPDWLWEALQAAGSGVPTVGSRAVREGNKPLAGLGDRILAMAIVNIAVDQNLTGDLGDTNTRIQVHASNARLASLCDDIGLTGCIERNVSQQGLVSQSVKSATVEAVLGAAFKDGGMGAAQQVMQHLRLI
ncbi:RNase [Colletotrichum musicola]|uniref:RNase n=1 Tax=Colletotrichum musicola TaxID=2175873 RepID=A0A8H6JTC1_9PEZI|nr:RNase [Colletotrichum musicola]